MVALMEDGGWVEVVVHIVYGGRSDRMVVDLVLWCWWVAVVPLISILTYLSGSCELEWLW